MYDIDADNLAPWTEYFILTQDRKTSLPLILSITAMIKDPAMFECRREAERYAKDDPRCWGGFKIIQWRI